MAFKEYSKNDFLYSGFDISFCTNKTIIDLDDLIDSSCKRYGTAAIDVTLNDVIYTVTPTDTPEINTIHEIADDFTKKSPYIFSYNATNELIVESAKIRFDTSASNSASTFLGYNEDGVNHKLPYTFPNAIRIMPDTGYAFGNSYKFGSLDIRAAASESTPYYDNNNASTNTPYTDPLRLRDHLNKNKIGFKDGMFTTSASPYYKFEYDNGKLKVVDLIREETVTTITIAGNVYTINKPTEDITTNASSDDIVLVSDSFSDSFRYWTTADGAAYKKINPPTVTYKNTITDTDITITGRFDNVNKKYVCIILPDFTLEFKDKTSSPTLVYSASKYVKYDSKYHTLPKVVTGPTSTNSDEIDKCNTAKQNRALCDNKEYADKLMALTTTHPGASERYDNIRGFTDMSILNIFNLGIGILATGVFIAQTYK